MAREHDLPNWLAAVHPRYQVPHHAKVVLAVVICLVITVADLRHATGFSSSGVFVDYLLANIAAFTHLVDDRRCPKAWQAIGELACSTSVVTLPPASALTGVGAFFVGILLRVLRLRQQRRLPGTGKASANSALTSTKLVAVSPAIGGAPLGRALHGMRPLGNGKPPFDVAT